MICKRCGTEFKEGFFCPECGMKCEELNTEKVRKIENERVEEKESQEEQRKDTNKKIEDEKRERIEAEKIAKEKMQLEKEKLEEQNKKIEIQSRTVRGTLYKSLEEAEKAKKEHNAVDRLKTELLEEKSQKRRQQILSEFYEKFETVDALNRYEQLKIKVNKDVPFVEKINLFYGISVLITFIISVVILFTINGEANFIGKFCIIWAGFGVCVWPIWKIIQIINSKKAGYYKNLKNI